MKFIIFIVTISITLFSGCTILESHKESHIQSYRDCVAAGYPSTRSMPPKCYTRDGHVFIGPYRMPENLKEKTREIKESPVCRDFCGNGRCDAIVCKATGCPCPETPQNCPEDCNAYFSKE